MFECGGETCVVHEPFGDNSRYWIGPAFPERSAIDMRPIQQAFAGSENVLQRILEGIGARRKGS